MRHRVEFEPNFGRAIQIAQAERKVQAWGLKAPLDDREAVAHLSIKDFVRTDNPNADIHWRVTGQYDGRNTYYASSRVFVVFPQADEMRRRLHKLGFATFWEAYDPDPTSPDWLLAFSTSAAKTWPHDSHTGPWGTIAYFDGTDVYR